MNSEPRVFPLDVLPAGATLRAVTATPVQIDGRQALRVALRDEVAANGRPGVDFVDMPTFVRIPVAFRTGVVEFDLRSRLLSTAPEYARAFAGIAYRIDVDAEHFECVYVRPMNGRKLSPPAPRDGRAVQYFAYPDWKFDRLRAEFAEGTFEAGADIGPDEWIRVRVDIEEASLLLSLNGVHVLHVHETLVPASIGDLGLWVDIGTEAFFSNLTVTHVASAPGVI